MKQAKADSFGYSDTRLWYGLTVFCGAVLILIPVIGSFWEFSILMIPAYSICKDAAKRYTKTHSDIAREVHEYVALAEIAYNFDVFTLVPNPLYKTPSVSEVRKRLARGLSEPLNSGEFRRDSLVSSK